MDRRGHCVKGFKSTATAIVEISGDDGSRASGRLIWGGVARSETASAAETFSRSAQAVRSLRRKVLDLLEIHDRWIGPLRTDCRPLALFVGPKSSLGIPPSASFIVP